MQVVNKNTKKVFNLDREQAENLIANFEFMTCKSQRKSQKTKCEIENPDEMKILGLENSRNANL